MAKKASNPLIPAPTPAEKSARTRAETRALQAEQEQEPSIRQLRMFFSQSALLRSIIDVK